MPRAESRGGRQTTGKMRGGRSTTCLPEVRVGEVERQGWPQWRAA
jgi:hypothetical protein